MPCRVLDRLGHGLYRAVGTRRIRLAEARTRPTGAAFSGTVLWIVSGTPLPCMAVPGGTVLIGAAVLPGCGALLHLAVAQKTLERAGKVFLTMMDAPQRAHQLRQRNGDLNQ